MAGNVRSFGLVGLIVPFIPFWNSGEDKNEFTIVLTFLPESANDLSFAPQQVVLETEQGVLMPAGIFRGDFITDDPQLFIRGNKKQAGPVLLNRELRIWLTFPVKPIPPGDRFSVVLNGLSRSGLPIEALRLEFQRQLSLRIIYFLPTLNIHNMGPSIDAKWVISR